MSLFDRMKRCEQRQKEEQQKKAARQSVAATVPLDFLKNTFEFVVCINLKRRPCRWRHMQQQIERLDWLPPETIQHFEAVDGKDLLEQDMIPHEDYGVEWDSTGNCRHHRGMPPRICRAHAGECGQALSHIGVWRQLVGVTGKESTNSALVQPQTRSALILEDDVILPYDLERSISQAPHACDKGNGWDILYLGFMDRGDREFIAKEERVQVFKPDYGFRTHAYAIKATAAETFLKNLPVRGPLGTWLADNHWFGLKVRRAVVNRGPRHILLDIVKQEDHRNRNFSSDVKASIYPENES